MARPSTFVAVASTIIAAKGAGATHEQAARKAGIAARTLRLWLRRGDLGQEPFATFTARFRDAQEAARRRFVEEQARLLESA